MGLLSLAAFMILAAHAAPTLQVIQSNQLDPKVNPQAPSAAAAGRCQSNGQCGWGQSCRLGVCILDPTTATPTCQSDANCGPKQSCIAGKCGYNPSRCSTDTDCFKGLRCQSSGLCG